MAGDVPGAAIDILPCIRIANAGMNIIESGPLRLAVLPEQGGCVASLDWHGHPLLRRQLADGVLNSGCFPLVPFSNRLRGSRFRWQDREVQLLPNHPDLPGEPVLHGFGWRLPWRVTDQRNDRITLAVDVPGSNTAIGWPWAFRAHQSFQLDGGGAVFGLAVTNMAATPMPAGLGFHPYFPCTSATLLRALHRGEWQTDGDCLPTILRQHAAPIDWWRGQPVASRCADTVYTQREGPFEIIWPETGVGLTIKPDDDLPFTTIYVPANEAFFCAEPVSHITDGFNRAGTDPGASGVRVLAPGERWQVSMRLQPFTRS